MDVTSYFAVVVMLGVLAFAVSQCSDNLGRIADALEGEEEEEDVE